MDLHDQNFRTRKEQMAGILCRRYVCPSRSFFFFWFYCVTWDRICFHMYGVETSVRLYSIVAVFYDRSHISTIT